MHILKSSPKLKHCSHSLPLLPGPVAPVHPIHKARKNNLQSSQHSAFLPFISLQDKTHGEEVDCKIRGIQRRNVRKLEERYDTIDRWKEKYIPEASMLIIRHKMAIEKALPQMESSHELHKSSATVSRGVNNKFQKLLPIISAKILSIQVPDHRQLSRRLQMELVSRLERNKRLHAKGKLAQAINYFQSSSRQNIENSRKKCKIINHSDPIQPRQRPHKGSLDSPFSHFDKHMSHAGYKGPTNPEDDRLELFQAIRMRKAKSIVEFKEDLFNEAVEQAPQGWAVSNQPPFGDEQD